MQHGYQILSLDEYPANCKYLRLWDIGVTWAHVNPAPDSYDWSRLDKVLEVARASGTNDFLYVLGMTPQWAAINPNTTHHAPWIGPGTSSIPADLATWDKYVWNVATRYKGIIQFYQVWNEPQLRDFWDDYTKISVLGEMTKRAKSIIRKVDPDARIVAAPVLPRPSSGGMKKAMKYLTALKDNKWPVGVLTAHIYPEKGKGPDRWKEMLISVQDGLKAIEAPKRSLWITETCYNLLGGPIPESFIPEYIDKTHAYGKALGVKRTYHYAYGTHSNPMAFGIPFTKDSAGTLAMSKYL